MVPCFINYAGNLRWIFKTAAREQKFPYLVARLNANNDDFQDFFVLPTLLWRKRWTTRHDDVGLEKEKG